MLKDKDFYVELLTVLRQRQFYNHGIWSYAFYHHDLQSIKEYMAINTPAPSLPIFEYFPYYSPRTHKFANENKSTIRN